MSGKRNFGDRNLKVIRGGGRGRGVCVVDNERGCDLSEDGEEGTGFRRLAEKGVWITARGTASNFPVWKGFGSALSMMGELEMSEVGCEREGEG
jgi:hypothetical protein